MNPKSKEWILGVNNGSSAQTMDPQSNQLIVKAKNFQRISTLVVFGRVIKLWIYSFVKDVITILGLREALISRWP